MTASLKDFGFGVRDAISRMRQDFPDEHLWDLHSCFRKGDCERFGGHVLTIGDKLASELKAWVSQSDDCLFAAFELFCRAGGGGDEDVFDVKLVFLIAHVLLTPTRVVVLPLQRKAGDVWSFQRKNGCLNFQLVYDFLASVLPPGKRAINATVTAHSFSVVDWDSLLLKEEIKMCRLWPLTERR